MSCPGTRMARLGATGPTREMAAVEELDRVMGEDRLGLVCRQAETAGLAGTFKEPEGQGEGCSAAAQVRLEKGVAVEAPGLAARAVGQGASAVAVAAVSRMAARAASAAAVAAAMAQAAHS